jgi:hypothetical protein
MTDAGRARRGADRVTRARADTPSSYGRTICAYRCACDVCAHCAVQRSKSQHLGARDVASSARGNATVEHRVSASLLASRWRRNHLHRSASPHRRMARRQLPSHLQRRCHSFVAHCCSSAAASASTSHSWDMDSFRSECTTQSDAAVEERGMHLLCRPVSASVSRCARACVPLECALTPRCPLTRSAHRLLQVHARVRREEGEIHLLALPRILPVHRECALRTRAYVRTTPTHCAQARPARALERRHARCTSDVEMRIEFDQSDAHRDSSFEIACVHAHVRSLPSACFQSAC